MTQNHTHLAFALLRLAAEAAGREPHMAEVAGDHGIFTPFSNTNPSDWIEGVRLWNEHGRHLMANLPKRNCPACGEDNARQLFRSYDGHPFVECLPCGCWYVPLKVEAELFERFFKETPEAFEVLQRTLAGRSIQASHHANLERIGAYLDVLIPLLPQGETMCYLDIGCGLGQSLQAAQARGLQATGVESSRDCVALTAQSGLEVFHVSDNGLQDRLFQLISFWESLEHMVDPAALLKECATRLAPGGLLAFTVPNQNSPLVRTQREDCSFVNGGYDTPGHINLLNPETIKLLLDRSGYTLLALDGQYGSDFGELISYLLGKQRSAHDLLQGRIIQNGLSDETNILLRAIGPACSLLERITLTAPILFGFACRKADTANFALSVADYQKLRREKLLKLIHDIEPVPDDIALLRHQLTSATDRIAILEDQLRVARNPLRRLVRFVRGKLNPPKG